jgi:DNA polymerase-3 subunit epsilon
MMPTGEARNPVLMDFVVIDVETATADPSSICQVGIASFLHGRLEEAWQSLVNPECDFAPAHVAVHGIHEDDLWHAPSWDKIYPEVNARLAGQIVFSHTLFDRVALERARVRFSLTECECRWVDSAKVARIAWSHFARGGYNLPSLAAHFGIAYRAHDALEDARCTGLMLLRAMEETALGAEQWLDRVVPRANPKRTRRARSEPAR